jgi:hypothetical protein
MPTTLKEDQTQTDILYTIYSEETDDDQQEKTEQPEFDDASH